MTHQAFFMNFKSDDIITYKLKFTDLNFLYKM